MNYRVIPYQSGEIVVLGDLHYDSFRRFALCPINMWVLQDIIWNADALILAGDLTNGPAENWAKVFRYLSEFIPPERIYALPGNHDYYGGLLSDDPALRQAAETAGAHFVQKQALLHGDTRVLCCTLWTDFNLSGEASIAMREADRSMADYDRIGAPADPNVPTEDVPIMRQQRRLKPRETLRVHQDHRTWLNDSLACDHPSGKDGKTVIVTHHGPHPAAAGEIDTLSAAFHSDMNCMIEQHRPDVWFFGHSHRRICAKVHGTEIRNISIGYLDEMINQPRSYLREMSVWKSRRADA
ncbi:metallophosphoesterase [Halocynthiibacter namhaensis]|uniref:metallophosphoesterase n=1 Tax=Halocynthiibacter namhaensis TaxID=1290553 RepID=UPI0006905A84|nr:metallophosphoesterase [Halocynthiibacter namhaensis]